MRVGEISPNTVEGSFSDDLVISKLWLIQHLKEIKNDFSTIYILGSWFGNLGLLMTVKHIKFDKIINVEVDKNVLKIGKDLADKMGISDKIERMLKDANTLDYRQIDNNSLVINTSCNNMKNTGWFDNIPDNTLVVLQGRNNDPGAVNKHNTLDEFVKEYPVSEILYKGSIELEDPEVRYDRFMIIGYK